MRGLLSLPVLAGLGLAGPALAEVGLTTGEFKDRCAQEDAASEAFCTGYAQAVTDFARITNSACIPDEIRASDALALIRAASFDKIGTAAFPEDQKAIAMALAIVNKLFSCDR